MKISWVLPTTFALLFVSSAFAQSADSPECGSSPRVVGTCFTVRGRLNYWNGAPSTRIWIVGTHRVLGLPDEDSNLPSNVKQHLRGFGDEIFADFKVCPYDKFRKGEMVCVQSATNVRLVHIDP